MLFRSDEAAAKRVTKERKGSAPAPPLRKFYKRGYAVEDTDGNGSKQGELETEGNHPPADFKTAGGEESESEEVIQEDERLAVPGNHGEVVVEIEAPSHTKDGFGPSDDDHNPWA